MMIMELVFIIKRGQSHIKPLSLTIILYSLIEH